MIGKIHDSKTMFLRNVVGTAKNGRKEYEMTTNEGGNNPIVRSKQTGKWFTLTWGDIINLAIAAGIDKGGKKR